MHNSNQDPPIAEPDSPGEEDQGGKPDAGRSGIEIPGWLPWVMAAVIGGIAAGVIYSEDGFQHPIGPWFVLACAVLGFVIGGVMWIVDRRTGQADHPAFWAGVVFGFFSLALLIGFLREAWDPEVDLSTKILGGGVILGLGGLSAVCFGVWRGRRWAERAADVLTAAAAVGIMLMITGSMFLRALGWDREESVYYRGEGVVLALAIVWVGFGLLMYLSSRRSGEPKESAAESLSTAAFWPALALLKAPLGCGVLLVAVLCFAGGGELIGARFDHPYLGAILGLAVLVASSALLVYLIGRST